MARIYNYSHPGLKLNLVKTRAYCSGNRPGLGINTIAGQNAGSLTDCAQYALADPRCDGSGYFDASTYGQKAGAYQCRCPSNGACLSNEGNDINWNIYLVTKSGTFLCDHTV